MTALFKTLCCDAFEALEALDEPIAAMVTDPPYASGGFSEAAKLKARGRRFFGADRDAAFVQIANERLAAAQPRLRFAERAQDETRDLLAAPTAGLE